MIHSYLHLPCCAPLSVFAEYFLSFLDQVLPSQKSDRPPYLSGSQRRFIPDLSGRQIAFVGFPHHLQDLVSSLRHLPPSAFRAVIDPFMPLCVVVRKPMPSLHLEFLPGYLIDVRYVHRSNQLGLILSAAYYAAALDIGTVQTHVSSTLMSRNGPHLPHLGQRMYLRWMPSLSVNIAYGAVDS